MIDLEYLCPDKIRFGDLRTFLRRQEHELHEQRIRLRVIGRLGDLPADIRFADIESRSLWTVEGAPLHLFREMRGRQCAVIPRAVDDGSLAGMQCNLALYDQDGFIRSAAENGTSGLLIQLTHVRGNEHNVGYLAAGMWDPALTPQAWYERYCQAAEAAYTSSSANKAI